MLDYIYHIFRIYSISEYILNTSIIDTQNIFWYKIYILIDTLSHLYYCYFLYVNNTFLIFLYIKMTCVYDLFTKYNTKIPPLSLSQFLTIELIVFELWFDSNLMGLIQMRLTNHILFLIQIEGIVGGCLSHVFFLAWQVKEELMNDLNAN